MTAKAHIKALAKAQRGMRRAKTALLRAQAGISKHIAGKE